MGRVGASPLDRIRGVTDTPIEVVADQRAFEALLVDLEGVAVSTGSACTSGALDPSHVLMAIGLPHEIAHGSLRLTFGEANTEAQVEYLVECLENTVTKLREMSPLYEDFMSRRQD